MKTHCQRCSALVTARFREGRYHFHHCGRHQSRAARDLGRAEANQHGTAAGAAIGLLGAIGTAVNPLGAVAVGALLGSAFNGDNRNACHKCGHAAYPTGRRGKQGDPMYQCSKDTCRAFTFVRSR